MLSNAQTNFGECYLGEQNELLTETMHISAGTAQISLPTISTFHTVCSHYWVEKIKHPLRHCDSRALLRKSYVQSLIAEHLEMDKSHQTAIWHVKRSKEAHTSGFIHFYQKCSIVKLEETMLRFSTFFDCHQK